ncbi:hypothetical protein [Cylindrospermopsis raciborskii]|nr:hypothetical protein [Cylindrospermopsis raciborskii]
MPNLAPKARKLAHGTDLKQKTAEEYGGTDAQVSPTDRAGRWDCKFKVWR